MNAIPVERTAYQEDCMTISHFRNGEGSLKPISRPLGLDDVLANAGSRSIPYFLVDTVDGEVVERLQVANTTVREHANRAQRWSRIGHEFEYEHGEVVAAVSINEVRGER